MKRNDWADKQATKIAEDNYTDTVDIAGRLRAAEKRGFKRAVKLLHGETSKLAVSWPTVAEKWNQVANWLEEQERK